MKTWLIKNENLLTPRATLYAELGGSWKSEVNKGNHAMGQDKSCFIFIRQKLLRVEICIYQIDMTKKVTSRQENDKRLFRLM